ncbi:MAG: hypothetical protein FGM15_05060 [Chthoniobacterales bacterium]|nr:hypothetical protein [Chthoniobacterales bacterium]
MKRWLELALALTCLAACQSRAATNQNTSPFSGFRWPWLEVKERKFETLFHSSPLETMQKDQAVAERGVKADHAREMNLFKRQHRAKLQHYVDTRIELAVEKVRRDQLFAEQTGAEQENQSVEVSYTTGDSGGRQTPYARNAISTWFPRQQSGSSPSPANSSVSKPVALATEVVKRTKHILQGSDLLVESSIHHGIPKELAVLVALFMLHVPSVAVVSAVMGVTLIRRRYSRTGALLLGLAAILAVVIFFAMP